METGLKNRYDDPAAVGADRIVNAVAAGHHYGFPAIIVDIGTATTVEAVDGEGCYSGLILTGLYVALDALVARTAPERGPRRGTPSAIATNTPDSIRSGFVYGYAGAMTPWSAARAKSWAKTASGSSPLAVPRASSFATAGRSRSSTPTSL